LLDEIGLILIFGVLEHLLNGFEGLVAVLEDELHELVESEELVLGGEFLAVVFAVGVLHVAVL
jgi:hypothetical protein